MWRPLYILDDIPFSFSEGPDNGESKVTVLRFSQDWLQRDARTVLAARSQLSFGLDAFDATVNDIGTDGRFVAWLGQFQWVQQFSPRLLLVTRVNTQLTPDSLLPLERFGFGGVETVRGYSQNQLVTDNGFLASIEARIPLTDNLARLQLTPFLEMGHGWNNRTPDPERPTLASLGIGLRWSATSDLILRVDYGIPLIDVNNTGNSLQDNGLYFSLFYEPL
jgi:hemolysin activation/secretion protein